MKLPLLILLLVAAPSSGAQSSEPTPAAVAFARRIAGCYRLDDGPWRADSVQAGGVSTRPTPLSFELTAWPLRGWAFLQSSDRPMFAVRAPSVALTYWQRIGAIGDSIRISYPMPNAGVRLTVTPQGADLTGSVTAFTDAIREGQPSEITRPVYAHRTVCLPD